MKAVHLLTNPTDHREARSIGELCQIMPLAGVNYVPIVNPIWTEPLPIPRECNDRPFELTSAHYGCYRAHKDAIAAHIGEEGLWIFECDAVFTVDHEEAAKRMKRVVEVCNKHPEIMLFQLGYRHNGQGMLRIEDDVITINQFIETHSYFIPGSSKPVFDAILAEPWDAYDYTITIRICDRLGGHVGIFDDRPICVQGVGTSLIDNKLKGSEPHFRDVRYKASMDWKP